MTRNITIPWTRVSNGAGQEGRFKVEDGRITVECGGKTKTTRASSNGLPSSLANGADEGLAKLMLYEFV